MVIFQLQFTIIFSINYIRSFAIKHLKDFPPSSQCFSMEIDKPKVHKFFNDLHTFFTYKGRRSTLLGFENMI